MNLHYIGAFIRTPFFLLSLLDTVSNVQASWDTLSGHFIVLLPDSSLMIPARSSVLQGRLWPHLQGQRMLGLRMVIRSNHLQQDSAHKIKSMDTKQVWCKMRWSKENIKLFHYKVALVQNIISDEEEVSLFLELQMPWSLEVCQNSACEWRAHK